MIVSKNKYLALKKKIVEIEEKLVSKGLVVGPAGNVSCRTSDENTILITPSGIPRDKIKPQDILLIDFEGEILQGSLNPSREAMMHISIYKIENDAGAVIHSHPTYATTLSIVGKPIPPLLDEFVVFVGKKVKLADYAMSGSNELAKNVSKTIKDSRAVLLSNNCLIFY
jgi:L-fuculose-phosphate aldolase